MVAVVMAVAMPIGYSYFWLFPIYSPLAFLLIQVFPDDEGALYFAIAVGWLYYVALTILGLRARHRVAFAWFYIILCLSLLLNCAGCISAALKGFGC